VRKISRQTLALGVIGHEFRELASCFRNKAATRSRFEMRDFFTLRMTNPAEMFHAVENIAHVMQHVGRNFRHAPPAGSVHQLPVKIRQLRLGAFAFRDVLRRAHNLRHGAIQAALEDGFTRPDPAPVAADVF